MPFSSGARYGTVFEADLHFGVVEGQTCRSEGVAVHLTRENARRAFRHPIGVDERDTDGVEEFIQIFR